MDCAIATKVLVGSAQADTIPAVEDRQHFRATKPDSIFAFRQEAAVLDDGKHYVSLPLLA